MSMNKAVPVSASPSSLPVVVSNPDNISYVQSKQGPLRINRPLTAVSSSQQMIQQNQGSAPKPSFGNHVLSTGKQTQMGTKTSTII